MKNRIFVWLCTLAILTGSFWALAEETSNGTDTSTSVTTVTETTSATDSTTEGTETTTNTTITTGTTTPTKVATYLDARVVNGSIVVKLKDANDLPVANAEIVLTVDGNIYRGHTDQEGTWVFGANLDPTSISCVFEGNASYQGSSYSNNAPTSATSSEATTTPTTEETTITTTRPSQNTSVSFLSTVSGTQTAPTEVTQPTSRTSAVFPIDLPTQPGQTTSNSSWLSTLLIGLAILLFVGAGVMIYLFIIRKPAEDWEDEEAAELEDEQDMDRSLSSSADEDLAISLDKLFENQTENTEDDDIRL